MEQEGENLPRAVGSRLFALPLPGSDEEPKDKLCSPLGESKTQIPDLAKFFEDT